MACLGLAQADAAGNVNVSRFGARRAGAGGFINFSQNARAVVLVATFAAHGLEIGVCEAGIETRREGRTCEFLETVEQIAFSCARGAAGSACFM